MAQKATTDGGNERKTTRFDGEFSLEDVQEGDRIDPYMIPSTPAMEPGDLVGDHIPKLRDDDDEREFTVRLIVGGKDSWGDVQSALVYDPEADLFARISGHTNSGAMSQKERDWKVRDVGADVEVVDQWDVEIPDLGEFGETEEEFVEGWIEILFDNLRYGEDAGDEIQAFSGKTFTLRDYDGRSANVEYILTDR